MLQSELRCRIRSSSITASAWGVARCRTKCDGINATHHPKHCNPTCHARYESQDRCVRLSINMLAATSHLRDHCESIPPHRKSPRPTIDLALNPNTA